MTGPVFKGPCRDSQEAAVLRTPRRAFACSSAPSFAACLVAFDGTFAGDRWGNSAVREKAGLAYSVASFARAVGRQLSPGEPAVPWLFVGYRIGAPLFIKLPIKEGQILIIPGKQQPWQKQDNRKLKAV